MNGAHLWRRGCYGQRWLCRASGSDSVLRLQPVIVFTHVTSWARTRPLYWMSMLLSRVWFRTWNTWLALWYHLWCPSILWGCRDLCAVAAQQFVTPAGQVHIHSRLSPQHRSLLWVLLWPHPLLLMFPNTQSFPLVFVVPSFLVAHPSFHRVGLQGWAITERSLSSVIPGVGLIDVNSVWLLAK